MEARPSRPRNCVRMCTQITPKLRFGKQSRDLKLFDALNGLRHQRGKALTTYADVFIVVVGTVYREVVSSAAQPVYRELPRSPHTRSNSRPSGFRNRLRWTDHPRQQKRQGIKCP